MSDKSPVDQVGAVVDGYTWKVLEGGNGKKVIISSATNRGVGIEAWDDRIPIGHCTVQETANEEMGYMMDLGKIA